MRWASADIELSVKSWRWTVISSKWMKGRKKKVIKNVQQWEKTCGVKVW